MPVPLTDLDGSGYLRGKWANVRGTTGDLEISTPAPSSTTGTTTGSSR